MTTTARDIRQGDRVSFDGEPAREVRGLVEMSDGETLALFFFTGHSERVSLNYPCAVSTNADKAADLHNAVRDALR